MTDGIYIELELFFLYSFYGGERSSSYIYFSSSVNNISDDLLFIVINTNMETIKNKKVVKNGQNVLSFKCVKF